MRRTLSAIIAIILACCLSACATPITLPYRPPSAAPLIDNDTFTAADGIEIPYRSWLPVGKPKAIIIALHGFNDYSNAFDMPGTYFATHGVGLYAYDQRGFGRNAKVGFWPGQKNLTRDLSQFIDAVRAQYAAVPIILLGESMGGAVIINAFDDPDFNGDRIDRVVLSAPALWGGSILNPIYRSVLWSGAHLFPDMLLTGRGLKIVASDNVPMLIALGQDPLIIKATRMDAVYGLVSTMAQALDAVEAIKQPVLMLYGMNDQIVPRPPIELAAERITSLDFRMVVYDRGFHMLMRDLQRRVVWDDILAWIADKDAAMPSGKAVDLSEPQPKKAVYRNRRNSFSQNKYPL